MLPIHPSLIRFLRDRLRLADQESETQSEADLRADAESSRQAQQVMMNADYYGWDVGDIRSDLNAFDIEPSAEIPDWICWWFASEIAERIETTMRERIESMFDGGWCEWDRHFCRISMDFGTFARSRADELIAWLETVRPVSPMTEVQSAQ